MYTTGKEMNCFGMEGNKVNGSQINNRRRDEMTLLASFAPYNLVQLASQHASPVLSCMPHLRQREYMSMREYTCRFAQRNHMRR